MKLSIGIVGLPNVGKSTIFNALLKKQVANVANYPFCTIEPNVGVIEVPDERLPVIAKLVQTEKIVPAVVEFWDIAGLVKGASQGEGLGNQFLAHIRSVSAILHVVRLFEDGDIVSVGNLAQPVSDVEIVETELVLADLTTLEKQREPKGNASKEEKAAYVVIKLAQEHLGKGLPARTLSIDPEELKVIQPLGLLTLKPVLYIFNLSESQLEHFEESQKSIQGILSALPEARSIALCAKMENEVLALSEEEQREYLKQYHLEEIGFNRLIKEAYKLLGLISFLTGGEKEARAWTITKGSLAPQAAGTIHSDFEKHFIRADVIPFPHFVEAGGWVRARDLGKVLTVGRDYVMRDGDVVEFKVGV